MLQSLFRPVLTPLMRGMFDAPIASAVAAWSPADMPSLGAWYDPSDLSTMFQDAAGTTPVTAAGQPVGLILDKSGNGYHASQSTSPARPLFQIDGGGNAYLSFDGVDDYLSASAIDLTGTDKVAVFVGARVNSGAPAIVLETNTSGFSGGSFYLTSNEHAANIGTFAASGNAGGVNYTTTGQPAHAVTTAQLSSVFTNGVGAATARVNSAPQSMAVSYAGTSSGNFGNHPLYIAARGTPAIFWNGNLYSLIIGGAAYDAATVLAAEQWVADKTGVTL